MSRIAERLAAATPEEKRELLAQLLRKRAGAPRSHPLSFAQERLWFLDRLTRGSAAYNIPTAVRLSGRLDLAAFERSINEIRRRHEALRTTFSVRDEDPVQLVGPAEPLPVPLTDLGHLPEAEREEEARRLVTEEGQTPFSLEEGPLLRVRVLRLADEEHVVMVTMHHIVSDGWSMDVLLRELIVLYQAFSAGQPSPLPELPIQYGDFARRQRQALGGGAAEAQVAYWKRQLEGIPPVLRLPTDRPRPEAPSFRGAFASRGLPAELTEPLKALSRRHGATLFITLLTAFKVLLHFYSKQDDIVVGTPSAGREGVETEGLIGFFINTLILRTRIQGDPGFGELLGEVRRVVLEAQAHRDVPFEKVVEAAQPQRSVGHMPLFQVTFAFTNAPRRPPELPGLRMYEFGALSGTSKVDLELVTVETAQNFIASLQYNTDLFNAATADRMLAHFETLLAHILARPEIRLGELTGALAEAERRQKLAQEELLTQARLEKFKKTRRRGVSGV